MYDFKFNGKWLSQFGGRLTTAPSIEIAQRCTKLIDIPGRDKASLIDYGYYNNVKFERQIGLLSTLYGADSRKLIASVISWLAYSKGYCEFKDTEHNGMFTTAYLSNFEQVTRDLRVYSTATIKFNREPFWYLNAGQQQITYNAATISAGVDLYNPYPIQSLPEICIICQSNLTQLTANRITIKINNKDTYIDAQITPGQKDWSYVIDYATLSADINNNRYISYDFDTVKGFPPGKLRLCITSLNDVIKQVIIKPRWRCL